MTSAGTKREWVSLIVDLLAHSQVLVDFHYEDSINERYVSGALHPESLTYTHTIQINLK